MTTDRVALGVQVRTGFLAFGLGIAITIATFGMILLVSNDMRLVLLL